MIYLPLFRLRPVICLCCCFFALLTSAGAQPAATSLTDQELLASREALLPFLSPSQRLQYIQAQALVEAGESDLRTADYLSNRMPSKLNPNEDLNQVKARGRQLAIDARRKITQGNQEIMNLLRQAHAARLASAKAEDETFERQIERQATFESAFNAAAGRVLRASWDAGLNLLFFNGVHLTDKQGTQGASPEIRNQAYDALVSIDGTRFSVTVPFDLTPNAGTSSATRPFTFENMEVLDNGRVALLGIELITFDPEDALTEGDPEASVDGEVAAVDKVEDEAAPATRAPQLLVISAIHLRTLELVHQEMIWITDGSNLKDPRVATGNRLIEKQQSAQKLAVLPTPYAYRVETGLEDPVHASFVSASLEKTLLDNFNLKLVPVGFFKRAFGDASADNFSRFANARFTARPSTAKSTAFTVTATADATNQTLNIGTFELVGE